MYKLLLSIIVLIAFSGCGASSYSVPSKVSESDIVNSKEKAYVVFGVEDISKTRAEPIFEYIPETETFKLVTIMGSFQKYIYPIDEGTHYFYSMGGESYDFVKVEAIKGKKYFVNITTVFWSFRMTTPIVFEPTTDSVLISEFEDKTLVTNSDRTQKWYEQRKDNPKFKAAVKERFLDWLEDDMKDKTLNKNDGFDIN